MKTQEPTIPLTVRIDICDLATALRYMRKQGIVVRSKSHLIRTALHLFVDKTCAEAGTIRSASIEQSYKYVEREGFGPGYIRPGRALYSEIAEENVEKDSNTSMPDSLLQQALDDMEDK